MFCNDKVYQQPNLLCTFSSKNTNHIDKSLAISYLSVYLELDEEFRGGAIGGVEEGVERGSESLEL